MAFIFFAHGRKIKIKYLVISQILYSSQLMVLWYTQLSMPPNSGLLKWGWALHFLQRNFYLLMQYIPFNEKGNRNDHHTMTSNTLQSLLLIGMLCFLKGCIYKGCFLLSPLKTINHHLSNISLFTYSIFFLKFHQGAEGILSQLVPGPEFPVRRKMQLTPKILSSQRPSPISDPLSARSHLLC